MPLNTLIFTAHHCQPSLVIYRSWRKAMSMTDESFMTERRPYPLLLKGVQLDVGLNMEPADRTQDLTAVTRSEDATALMVVGIHHLLIETVRYLEKGYLLGGAALMGFLHGRLLLPITTEVESRMSMAGHIVRGTETGHPAIEEEAAAAAVVVVELVVQVGVRVEEELVEGTTSILTFRATSETVWTDTNVTAVEIVITMPVAEHAADHRLQEDYLTESGTITETADRFAVGLPPLGLGIVSGNRMTMNGTWSMPASTTDAPRITP